MKRTGAKGLFPVRLPYQPPATTPADARRRVGSRARPFLPGPRPQGVSPVPPGGVTREMGSGGTQHQEQG